MTDQDKLNSTSNNETVNEYNLTANFIQQFKKYKLGMLKSGLFAVHEQQALVTSIITDPQSTYSFLAQAQAVLRIAATEEFVNFDEVLDCIAVFNGQILQLMLFSVVPLLQMTPEEKAVIKQSYMDGEFQNPEDRYDVFTNLDFDMTGPKKEPPEDSST